MKIISRGQSSDYDRFLYMPGNREYRRAHAVRLADHIRRHNLLALFPVVCTRNAEGELVLVDGQHRVAAAKMVGVPFHYVVADDLTAADIRLINTGGSSWTTRDYLHHFVNLGRKDYVSLSDFCAASGIGLMTAAVMFANGNTTSGEATRAFREGKFKAVAIDRAMEVSDICTRLRDLGLPWITGRVYVLALARLCATGKLDAEVFARRADRIAAMLQPCATWQQFAEVFSRAYDYHRPNADRADLYRAVIDAERARQSASDKARKAGAK